METKEEAWAAIYKNQLWTIPVRSSRWRTVLEAAEAAGKSRQRRHDNMNVIERAHAHRGGK